jgi:hypothetical protein
MRFAAFGSQYPGAIQPWRIVAYMLSVATFEVRDPIATVVLVKAYNPASPTHERIVSISGARLLQHLVARDHSAFHVVAEVAVVQPNSRIVRQHIHGFHLR